MKLTKYILVAAATLAVVSCSKWTEPERKIIAGQGTIERIIPEPPAKPLIEIKSEEELNNTQREYYKQVREYRTTDHVRGFGWFGNWTGKGTDPMNYLKLLPDSVDFVSLWGVKGRLSDAQKADLKFFQEVKGGKALLCWIIAGVGDQLTPDTHKGREISYWSPSGNKREAIKAYANAICDTIEKYNLDGFDIDYEPDYGGSGSLANGSRIGSTSGNTDMYLFIKTMYDRLHPKGRMLVMDGQPDLLENETSKMIDFYIYQAYWEGNTSSVLFKVTHPHLENYKRKTIVTVEFEQGWRTGGIKSYSSSDPDVQAMSEGRQIFDYAVMNFPDGTRIAGIGTYHMEYDKSNDMPYRWLRQALDFGNKTKPGKFK